MEEPTIGVFVIFRYQEQFNQDTLHRIAQTACGKFEGMPGLRSKAFTVNPERREAINLYIWDSEDAAKGFFMPETLERIAALYGVKPSLEFVQIAALVENVAAVR